MAQRPAKRPSSPGGDAQEKTFTIRPLATALTIAGSDPSGGAGLQADLKTFQQLGVYGMSVVTLITVQNTVSVERVEVLSPDLVAAQFQAVMKDIPPRAIKVGALGNAELVRTVAELLQDVDCPVIVDPVLVSKHGQSLVTDDVVDAYRQYLLPQAYLVTPNRFETERLTGLSLLSDGNLDDAMLSEAVHELHELGVPFVLIKAGQSNGKFVHVLGLEQQDMWMEVPYLSATNLHGSGCVLSAAITAQLALGGQEVSDAVDFAIRRVFDAISCNTELGQGVHPVEVRAMQP